MDLIKLFDLVNFRKNVLLTRDELTSHLHFCFLLKRSSAGSFFPSIFHGEIGRERKLCLGSRVTLYVVLFFRFSLQIVKSWAGRTTSVRGNR